MRDMGNRLTKRTITNNKKEVVDVDMGWTKYQDEIEKTEEAKCEGMRRTFGLIVSNDPEAYDCTCCDLNEKCGGG